jgi:RNA polymerase sigma-70 factor, ECF subfamily
MRFLEVSMIMNVLDAEGLPPWWCPLLGALSNAVERQSECQMTPSALTQSAALDQFLRANERRALRVLQLGTRNVEDALDLLQDAMLAFAKRYGMLPKFDCATARADEWPKLFHTVLHSKLNDFHRRNTVINRVRIFFGAKKTEQEDALSNVEDLALPSPDRLLSANQSRPIIERALRALPHRQRQAFLLRIWEGFDVAQTAQIMNCSDGSVKTHLFRALTSLRDSLQAWRFEE